MRWPASLLAAWVVLATAGVALAQPADAGNPTVRQAIVAAVQARMGQAAEVRIDRLTVTLDSQVAAPAMTATPEPGARTGELVRFTLSGGGAALPTTPRLGWASAEIHVVALLVKLSRPVSRGSVIGDGDIEMSPGDVGTGPMAPVPVPADVVGSRASRDLPAGQVLSSALLRAQPLVRSGDTVRTRVSIGQVEVYGSAIAQQSGNRDDQIRLLNPDSRRALVGRVTGAGEVEVIHVQ